MINYSIDNFADIIDNATNATLSNIFNYTLTIFMVILGLVALFVMFLVYMERKVAAAFQCRMGPNRVGWKGIMQSIADLIKLLIKEKITPMYADSVIHFFAPFLCLSASFMAILIVPFSPNVQVINIDIGILYWTAVSSLGILGILLAGWSSYNKWSLLSAIRSASQLISYELSIILSIITISIFTNTFNMQKIVMSQINGFWIWRGHISTVIAFVIFFIASVAELNKAPFDLPEGESELGAGFHTEYSGIQFAFFFLAEYVNLFTTSAIIVMLFLGGWLPLNISGLYVFNNLMNVFHPLVWLFFKVFCVIFCMMWIRWTFPRLRIDQLINLEWKFLLPISLINLVLASTLVLNDLYFYI
jgi:NADH-quinone oxidoreductase subunit H